MANTSVERKIIKVSFWANLGVFCYQTIGLISTIVLARILTPSQCGLVGMISIFITLGNVFSNGGLGAALVRKNNISHTDASSVFWFNVVVSLCCYLILFCSAGFIAGFFGYPILKLVIRISCLSIIINALGVVQGATAQIGFRFKETAIIHALSAFIATVVAISMALFGCGIWALVAHSLINAFVFNILLFVRIRFIPSFSFSRLSFNELGISGGKMLMANAVEQVSNNIHASIIGKFYPAASVGYYTKALNLERLPSDLISSAIRKIAFSFFSNSKSDEKNVRNQFAFMFRVMSFLTFPLFVGLAASAEWLIPIVLGDQWYESIRLMRILCIGGMFLPYVSLNQSLIKGTGNLNSMIYLALGCQFLLLLLTLIMFPFGVDGLTISVSASIFCNFVIYSIATRRLSEGLKRQIAMFSRYLISSLFMGLVAWFVAHFFVGVSALIICILTGMVVYSVCMLTVRDEFFMKIITVLHSKCRHS